MYKPDVLIVGAGLSGLCCARRLQKEGLSFRIVEGSDAVGGRVRTDSHDGFLLDRGFQVLQTAYPEAIAQLDFKSLDLRPFIPGAMVRHDGHFYRVTDPWRDRGSMLANLISPATRFGDKLRMRSLRRDVMDKSIEEIFASAETTARQALSERGFSRRAIERFFRPFLGGVLLDSRMSGSSRMFEFAFKMLSTGDAALPARGMQAIPEQLAAGLGDEAIRFHQRVRSVDGGRVHLVGGEVLEADAVVVATEGPEASQLLGDEQMAHSRSVCCLYFAAKEPPVKEPILVLSGSGRGPINNLTVPNLVAPDYAPKGEFLISATVLGMPGIDDQSMETQVRLQLKRWYGLVTEEWRLVRIYRIRHGLPAMASVPKREPARLAPGLYVCGDHRSTPSIQGAMESGRLAAETLIRDLRGEAEQSETEVRLAGEND